MSEQYKSEKMGCCFKARRSQLFDLMDGCQFEEETEFFAVDGLMYCRFHMPLKNNKGQQTKKGDWGQRENKTFENGIANLLNWAIRTIDHGGVADLTGVQFFNSYDFTAWARQNAQRGKTTTEDHETPAGGYSFPQISARKTLFWRGANFSDLLFPAVSDFSDVRFVERAVFSRACFGESALFDNAIFEGWSWFSDAKFADDVMFKNARFSKKARFDRVVFEGSVDFSSSNGEGTFSHMSFKEAKFASMLPCDWDDNIWHKGFPLVTFTNRKFNDSVDFRGATFHVAPDFHGAQLHQGCTIGEAEFKDVEQQDAPAFYRTLKLAMEQKRDWNAMAKFYALEQKSQRHQPETPWAIKTMSWAYEVLSDYGQNSVRPLIGLLVTAFVAFELYGLAYGALVGGGDVQTLVDILHFDVMQMVKPFDAIIGGVKIEGLGGFGRFIFGTIATLQTLTTIGLVTLFILAVRRRFRMA